MGGGEGDLGGEGGGLGGVLVGLAGGRWVVAGWAGWAEARVGEGSRERGLFLTRGGGGSSRNPFGAGASFLSSFCRRGKGAWR